MHFVDEKEDVLDDLCLSVDHLWQCAVRAATQGRILVIEGVEKAERNVLPVLNNLLVASGGPAHPVAVPRHELDLEHVFSGGQ